MSFAEDIKLLLFNPKEFFTDSKDPESLRLPLVFTAVTALITAITAYTASEATADMIGMPELTEMLGIISAISGFIMIFISWVFMAVVFFIFVKFITHSESGLRPFLAVTGYASLPILIGLILTFIIGFITPDIFTGWLGFLLDLLILLWCIPIWLYGFSAATNAEPGMIFKAIAIPIILMILFSIYGTFTGIEALEQMQSGGGSQFRMGPPR